jgi:serine/threonine-protein kinase
MLFEMLAGEPPFQGPQMASLIAAILNQPPPDLTQIRPDVPPDLAQLINQMLIKNREDRIGRMRQVAAHLDQIRSSTSPN